MEQTNRTILFEEINPEKENLLELIEDDRNKESLTDDMVEKIHRDLVVHSYEEAVEKFKPSVYLHLDTQSCFETVTEKRKVDFVEIPLYGEGSLLEKILVLMQKKNEEIYAIENLSELMENMFLERYYEDFQRVRISVFRFCCAFQEEQAVHLLDETIERFDEGMFLLVAFMKEVQNVLQGNACRRPSLVLGEAFPAQLKAIAISPEVRESIPQCLPQQKENYSCFIQQYLQKRSLKNPALMRELLLLLSVDGSDVEPALYDIYEKVSRFYTAAVKLFWKQAKSLLETMLGIHAFFAQYQQQPPKEKNMQRRILGEQKEIEVKKMEPVLLIANCKAGVIMQEKNRKRLQTYLETVNQKNDLQNKIWYAIVPGIENQSTFEKARIRERFLSERETEAQEGLLAEETLNLVKLLADCEVQSFLSLKTNGESGFAEFQKNGRASFDKSYAFLEKAEQKEYLIPAYPNFSIIPQSCMYYEIISATGEKERNWLEGIKIEASYVGAGLVAACQCPAYLRRFYKDSVDTHVPGVAYALTKDGHEKKTVTSMKKEVLCMEKDLLEDAVRHSRGMLFVPEGENVVAATDRAFSYKEASRDSISMIQTLSYLRRKIQYVTQDFREDRIKEFFQNRHGSLKSQWAANGKCVNAVIKEGEDLKCSIDSDNRKCTFIMEYAENTKQNIVRMNQ